MEKITLNAFERNTQPKKMKENGFVAGVIYGDNVKEANSVKFEEAALRNILTKHGSNAKVWVQYGEGKKFGFIKAIQRHPVTAKIIHVDIQLVSKEHEIKLQLPIIFNGEEALNSKQLQLNIHKSNIDVSGKMALMPDTVTFDVSEKEIGDVITINDFNLDKEIKVSDNEEEIYAVIAQLKEKPSEEVIDEVEVVADPEVNA